MAHVLPWQQTFWRTLGGVRATIRAILSAVTAEHTLALRAATKAALPRQSLAEVRAMYVPPWEPRQEDDAIAQSTPNLDTTDPRFPAEQFNLLTVCDVPRKSGL